MTTFNRRSFLTGLSALFASPSLGRSSSPTGSLESLGVVTSGIDRNVVPGDLFRAARGRYKGFCGPRGCGKTYELCREAHRLAKVNPGRIGVILSPLYNDFALDTFLSRAYESATPARYLRSTRSVHLENGSRVYFRSFAREVPAWPYASDWRGMSLAWGAIDQLDNGTREDWYRIATQLRDRQAEERCIVAAFVRRLPWIDDAILTGDGMIVDAHCRTFTSAWPYDRSQHIGTIFYSTL